MKCEKCGGNRTPEKCNICEILEEGLAYDGVEANRMNKQKLSDALAVHPRQVKEATESAKMHGVPTDFTRDGRPLIRSRSHQKAYLKAYGFHNKDGGYGD